MCSSAGAKKGLPVSRFSPSANSRAYRLTYRSLSPWYASDNDSANNQSDNAHIAWRSHDARLNQLSGKLTTPLPRKQLTCSAGSWRPISSRYLSIPRYLRQHHRLWRPLRFLNDAKRKTIQYDTTLYFCLDMIHDSRFTLHPRHSFDFVFIHFRIQVPHFNCPLAFHFASPRLPHGIHTYVCLASSSWTPSTALNVCRLHPRSFAHSHSFPRIASTFISFHYTLHQEQQSFPGNHLYLGILGFRHRFNSSFRNSSESMHVYTLDLCCLLSTSTVCRLTWLLLCPIFLYSRQWSSSSVRLDDMFDVMLFWCVLLMVCWLVMMLISVIW